MQKDQEDSKTHTHKYFSSSHMIILMLEFSKTQPQNMSFLSLQFHLNQLIFRRIFISLWSKYFMYY